MSHETYVWLCYALAALVIGAIAVVSFYDLFQQTRRLSLHRDFQREQKK